MARGLRSPGEIRAGSIPAVRKNYDLFLKIINKMKFLLLIPFFAGLTSSTITDCGNGNSIFQITKLDLTPDPPVIGKDVFLTLQFNNPLSDINDGQVTTKVSMNGIPYPPSTQSLCENTQCPIMYGNNDRSTNNVWPDISGKIDTTIEWRTPSEDLLLCIHTTVKVYSEEKMLRGKNGTIF